MDWLTLAYYGVIVAWAGWFFVRPAITITFGLEEHDRRLRRYRREQAKEGAGAGLLEGWKRAQESQHAETIAEIREIIEAPGNNPPDTMLLGPEAMAALTEGERAREAERAHTALRDFVGLAGESEHTALLDQRLTEISASYLRGREWFNAARVFPLIPVSREMAQHIAAVQDEEERSGLEVRPSDYGFTTEMINEPRVTIDTEVARRVAAQMIEETERSYVQGLPSISGTFRGRWDDAARGMFLGSWDDAARGMAAAQHRRPAPEPKTATLRERRRAMELEDGNDE